MPGGHNTINTNKFIKHILYAGTALHSQEHEAKAGRRLENGVAKLYTKYCYLED